MMPFDYIPAGKKAMLVDKEWQLVPLDEKIQEDAVILLAEEKLKTQKLENLLSGMVIPEGDTSVLQQCKIKDLQAVIEIQKEGLEKQNQTISTLEDSIAKLQVEIEAHTIAELEKTPEEKPDHKPGKKK